MQAVATVQEEFLQVPTRKGKSKPNALVDRLTQFMTRRMSTTGSREFREQDLRAMAGNVDGKDWDKALVSELHRHAAKLVRDDRIVFKDSQ